MIKNKIYKDLNKKINSDPEIKKQKKGYLDKLNTYIGLKISLEDSIIEAKLLKKTMDNKDPDGLINDLPLSSLKDYINFENGKKNEENLFNLIKRTNNSRKKIEKISSDLEDEYSNLRLLKIEQITKTINKILEESE